MSVEDRLLVIRGALNGRRDQVRDRTQELVDAALDRIFAEPLDVPDSATALRLLSDDRLIEDSEDVGARMARFAMVSLPVALSVWRRVGPSVRLAGRVTPSGRGVRLALAAVPLTAGLISSARHGVHELQVLASLLVSRLRAAGLPADRGLVRALVLSIYLNPSRPPDLESRVANSSSALARGWIVRAIPYVWHPNTEKRSARRIKAIETLDLASLHQTWRASTVIDI